MSLTRVVKTAAAMAAGAAPGFLYFLVEDVHPGWPTLVTVAGGFVGLALTLPSVSGACVFRGVASMTFLGLVIDPPPAESSPPTPDPPDPPTEPDPSVARWRTADVLGLARRIRHDHSTELFPILADALMDAGCDDVELLEFCRLAHGPAAAYWVIEALLGPEGETGIG
jgi:hypothetical protein